MESRTPGRGGGGADTVGLWMAVPAAPGLGVPRVVGSCSVGSGAGAVRWWVQSPGASPVPPVLFHHAQGLIRFRLVA